MLMLERYKGMTCRVDFKAPNSEEGYEFHGTVLGCEKVEIAGLPGPSLNELESQFKAAVDTYFELKPRIPAVCDIWAPDNEWPTYMHSTDLVYLRTKVGKLQKLYNGQMLATIGYHLDEKPLSFIGDDKQAVLAQVRQHFIKLEDQQCQVINQLTGLQQSVPRAGFEYMAYGYTMWLVNTLQPLDTAVQKVVDETPIDDLLNPTSKVKA